MYKAFKYRIYPTKKQEILINKHIGACRFVYNLALETKETAYKGNKVSLSFYDLARQIPELKKEATWLKEINAQSIISELKNLDDTYKRFFKGAGFPKYKSKWRDTQSFSAPQYNKITDGRLHMIKFREGIRIKLHRDYVGVIKTVTISRTPSGKYYASVLCDTGESLPIKKPLTETTTIGVDLGVKDFLITSNGDVVQSPKYYRKTEAKLKYVQRKYSKHKGKKTKIKLAKLHEKVANQRKDFLHNQSAKLVKENHSIAIEDLNVRGMMQNHKLAKSISDAGWSMFKTMLEYKSEWAGVSLLKIGRFEPSSKTCSNCGYINVDLTLKDRNWICPECGVIHDRDINAAINIKNFALNKTLSVADRENHDELPSLEGVLTHEVQTKERVSDEALC